MKHPAQKELDRQQSILLGTISGARLGHCYANAWNAFHLFGHPLITMYVEGWYIIENQRSLDICEHGWCETVDRIIDPTIARCPGNFVPLGYFPGVWYAKEEACEITEGLPHIRFSSRFGPDGLQNEQYCRALTDAIHFAAHLPNRNKLLAIHPCIMGYTNSDHPIIFERKHS